MRLVVPRLGFLNKNLCRQPLIAFTISAAGCLALPATTCWVQRLAPRSLANERYDPAALKGHRIDFKQRKIGRESLEMSIFIPKSS